MSCAMGKKKSKTRQFCKPYMGKSDVGLVTSNYKSKKNSVFERPFILLPSVSQGPPMTHGLSSLNLYL